MTREIDESTFRILRSAMGGELKALVTAYLSTSSEYVNTIRDAASQSDFRRVLEAAHPLKSSSAALGMVGLSEICAEIEGISSRKDLDDYDARRVKELAQEVPMLFEHSRSYLLMNS